MLRSQAQSRQMPLKHPFAGAKPAGATISIPSMGMGFYFLYFILQMLPFGGALVISFILLFRHFI